MFVRYAPRRHAIEELPVGSVGVVRDPDQRDVGIVWIGYEDAEPTRSMVFDIEDLTIITARDFAVAVMDMPTDRTTWDGAGRFDPYRPEPRRRR